jgi:hypothetical protein
MGKKSKGKKTHRWLAAFVAAAGEKESGRGGAVVLAGDDEWTTWGLQVQGLSGGRGIRLFGTSTGVSLRSAG